MVSGLRRRGCARLGPAVDVVRWRSGRTCCRPVCDRLLCCLMYVEEDIFVVFSAATCVHKRSFTTLNGVPHCCEVFLLNKIFNLEPVCALLGYLTTLAAGSSAGNTK